MTAFHLTQHLDTKPMRARIQAHVAECRPMVVIPLSPGEHASDVQAAPAAFQCPAVRDGAAHLIQRNQAWQTASKDPWLAKSCPTSMAFVMCAMVLD